MTNVFKKNQAFTIVELLIVIVVIGILAAITLVAYNGVTAKAADKVLQSDVNKVADELEAEGFNKGYATNLSTLNNGAGVDTNKDTVLQYTGDGTNYCVTAFSKKAAHSYYRSNTSNGLQEGMCPGHYNPFTPAPSLDWTVISPSNSNNRSDIDVSTDGSKVVIGDAQYSPGYVNTSTNSGASWTQKALGSDTNGGSYGPIQMSADGTIIAVLENYGRHLFVSTNSGASWTDRTATPVSNGSGGAFAMSADGQRMVYSVLSSGVYSVYTSSNNAVSWTKQTNAPSVTWSSFAMSGNGAIIVGVATDGYTYRSDDYGVTWSQQAGTAGLNLKRVKASSDGKMLLAVSSSSYGKGFVYTSTNSGATWTKQDSLGEGYWNGLDLSDSGSVMLVGADNYSGTVQLSTNGGASWTKQAKFSSYPQARNIAISGNGKVLYIAGGSGGVSYKASL